MKSEYMPFVEELIELAIREDIGDGDHTSLSTIDCIFGVLATTLACLLMNIVKNKFIASFFPAIFNGIIIGLELYYILKLPLLISMASVAIGEVVVVSILGNVLFYFINKNDHFKELIGIK